MNDARMARAAVTLTPARPRRRFLNRFRTDKIGIASVVVAVVIILLALSAPWISPYGPLAVEPANRLQGPSLSHPFGTDDLGRDLLTRVLWGSRISLRIAGIVVVFAVIIGVVAGAVAGFAGGFVDELMMRITDIFLAFPDIILAMAFSAMLGPSVNNAALALGLVWWPGYARLMRGQVLAIKNRDYVEASRSIGARPWRVLYRHIAPNSLDPILVRITVTAGHAILAGASLSFIGLGAQPPAPEWGLMVAVGRNFFLTAWWYPSLVGLAILIAVLAFTMAGDAIQDALNINIKDR